MKNRGKNEFASVPCCYDNFYNQLGLSSLIELAIHSLDLVFDGVLEAGHTCHGEDMGHTEEDDTDAEKRGERNGSDVHISKAKDAEEDTGDAQKQKHPPVGEGHFLVVEARDNDANTLDDHPNGEHKRERSSSAQKVEQEEATEEDVEQTHQQTGAAVRHKSLCLKGEYQFRNTRKKGHNAQNVCRWHKGDVGVDDEVDAKGDEKDACDAEPDFFTCFHNLNGFN